MATKDIMSDRLRNMKFMKRKEEAEIRKRLEQEQQQTVRAHQWYIGKEHLPPSLSAEEVEGTIASLLDHGEDDSSLVILGRRSFNKFNENTEKLLDEAAGVMRKTLAEKDTVSNEEMVARYSQYVGLRGPRASASGKKTKKKRKGNTDTDGKGNNSKEQGRQHKPTTPHSQQKQTPAAARTFMKPKDVL